MPVRQPEQPTRARARATGAHISSMMMYEMPLKSRTSRLSRSSPWIRMSSRSMFVRIAAISARSPSSCEARPPVVLRASDRASGNLAGAEG